MKKQRVIVAPLVVLALLSACGNGNASNDASSSQAGSSTFTGTLGDKHYEVAVTCRFFDTDSFMMKSDRTDSSDSNGDGIIISGEEFNGKFILTIIDNGVKYSTGRLANFSKGDNRAEGSGELMEDGGTGRKDVEFVVTCD